MKITPVLIICYRRYGNVLKLVAHLHASGVSHVYLALDGKSEGTSDDRESFLSELELLCEKTGVILEMWIRPNNLGPAVSIITAIDWFFTKQNFGVILEDDLEIGIDTIAFFQKSLKTYRDDPNVAIISGSNFWGRESSSLMWSSFPITWGWATWKNRWNDLRQVFFSSDTDFVKFGKLNERLFWKVGLHRCLSGRQDAWDIPFASYFRNLHRVCVFPPVNLISNIGVDAFAGNTFENKWPLFQRIGSFGNIDQISFNHQFKQIDCLDSSILSQIYGVTNKNIFSGLFYFSTHPFFSLKNHRHNSLSNRIASVQIP